MPSECPAYPAQPCRVNLDLMPHSTPLWMYFALLMGGGVISALAFRTWGADATGRRGFR